MTLSEKKCVPCEGGVPAIEGAAIENYMRQLKPGWQVADDKLIRRLYRFPDFATAIAFANRVAEIAETEQHHPDLHISWGKVTVELWTHAIGGLSENDFIVAAKIDKMDG